MPKTYNRIGKLRKEQVEPGVWMVPEPGLRSIFGMVSGLMICEGGQLRPVPAVASGQYQERCKWTAQEQADLDAKVAAFNAGKRWTNEQGLFL